MKLVKMTARPALSEVEEILSGISVEIPHTRPGQDILNRWKVSQNYLGLQSPDEFRSYRVLSVPLFDRESLNLLAILGGNTRSGYFCPKCSPENHLILMKCKGIVEKKYSGNFSGKIFQKFVRLSQRRVPVLVVSSNQNGLGELV